MARDTKVDPSIAEQAAEWWARLHDEGTSPADQREFGAWVARSPERIEAYLEVARLMQALRSGSVKWPDTSADELIRAARAAPGEPLPLRGNLPTQPRPSGPADLSTLASTSTTERFDLWWRRKSSWTLAAAVSLAVALAWFWLAMPQEYSTGFGEQRFILLADGSRVTLNTASRIEVDLQKRRRIVRLLEGEALFKVAHDPARPFDVLARGSVLRAVGTEFNVDLHDKQTTVTVVEGRVAVIPESVSADARESVQKAAGLSSMMDRAIARRLAGAQFPAPPGSLILVAAERVVITNAGPGIPQHVMNMAAATAWVEHRLVFDHEPLSKVAEQFNRYNQEQIVIEGADLARKEVTGVFQSDDPRSFLAFLSGIPGVTVHEQGSDTYVVRTAVKVSD